MQEEWDGIRDASIRDLPFPFSSYRPGQRQLAAAVYRTVRDEGRLLCQAPTGIGKTISTLYPAVKALGEDIPKSSFYLTAKTITRQATMDACEKNGGAGAAAAHHRPTAKDKICFLPGRRRKSQRGVQSDGCPTPKGISAGSTMHYTICLGRCDLYSRAAVEACAREHRVCPLRAPAGCHPLVRLYAWGLQLSFSILRCISAGFSTFRRALTPFSSTRHNLVDRAREMYSASLSKSTAWAVKKVLHKKEALTRALAALNKAFLALREGDTEERTVTRGGGCRHPPVPPQPGGG